MKAIISDFSIDFKSRKQRLTLTLDGDFRADFDKYHDGPVDVTVKPYRAKRSKDANAYCWELIGKLAEEMNLPAREIYRHAIRQVGVWQDVTINAKAEKTLTHSWEMHGMGWQTEKVDETDDGVILRLYYGSSVYNTKQMSRLIDSIVGDCKELGIETMTPAEISGLLDQWEQKGAKQNVS